MSGLSIGNFITFGTHFYFLGYKTLCNIDEKYKMNVFGLTMSLNRLIEFRDAFDFTEADLKKVTIMPLADPYSAAIAVNKCMMSLYRCVYIFNS